MRTHILHILAVAALLIFATSCDNEERNIRRMCEEISEKYPNATLQDVYKTCYQDFFGAEHLISDTTLARLQLRMEIEKCRDTDLSSMPEKEPTGYRHHFTRINLSMVTEGKMTESQLFDMFIDAASKNNNPDGDWAKEWEKIEKIALQVSPKWESPKLQILLKKMAKENQPVHHSDAFKKAYNPHYRIVRR